MHLGRKYSGGEGHKRFLQKIEEMREVKLTVHNAHTRKTRFSGILSECQYSDTQKDGGVHKNREWMIAYLEASDAEKKAKEQINAMFKGSCLTEIKISANYMRFFKEDLRVHCDPLVPEIVRIPDGTIRAIIQFFLTHEKSCHYSIRKVMVIVAAITEKTDKADVSRIMAKPEKFRAELENFRIFVEGDRLRYERHPKVFFTNPPGVSTGAVIDADPGPETTFPGIALEAAPEAKVEPKAPEK